MRKLINGSKPALVVAALVAVVGITGTAYAGKSPGSGSKGDSKQTQSWSKTDKTKSNKWDKSDKGDKADKADKADKDPKGGSQWGQWGHNKGGRASYGVATVNVSRGGQPATAWATYSTALGSPVGDNTGGVFRFTCSTANAPCTVSVGAAILARKAGTGAVYPRVLIYRQDYVSGGPEFYCEYGDGATTTSGPFELTKQPLSSTPTYAPVPVHIGGSADCSGPDPTAGLVNQITVGAGYYDVHSTFVFLPAA